MTLTIIFGALVLVGVGLIIWGVKGSNYYDWWREITGGTVIVLAAIALTVNLFVWIPSKKDSEIKYQQYIQEKHTIETMLNGDADVDRPYSIKRLSTITTVLFPQEKTASGPLRETTIARMLTGWLWN